MIAPNMATMLSFITTDAEIEPQLLQELLRDSVERSFNRVTVDGDTSTNDTVFLLANGQSGTGKLSDADVEAFRQGLDHVTLELAKMIARDGEGATKFVTVMVTGARDTADAKRAAMSVANSNLVKTALFGADPNWGRIACAAGYSGAEVDPERLGVRIGEVTLMEGGMPTSYDKDAAHTYLKGKDITISVDLGLGMGEAEVYTCDFSYDYVKINAEYTT
jgi:glutamate N-acetyltransferase/amino-acid N-acetyltransferase